MELRYADYPCLGWNQLPSIEALTMSTSYITTNGTIWGKISSSGVTRSYGHDALGSVIETYVGSPQETDYRVR